METYSEEIDRDILYRLALDMRDEEIEIHEDDLLTFTSKIKEKTDFILSNLKTTRSEVGIISFTVVELDEPISITDFIDSLKDKFTIKYLGEVIYEGFYFKEWLIISYSKYE